MVHSIVQLKGLWTRTVLVLPFGSPHPLTSPFNFSPPPPPSSSSLSLLQSFNSAGLKLAKGDNKGEEKEREGEEEKEALRSTYLHTHSSAFQKGLFHIHCTLYMVQPNEPTNPSSSPPFHFSPLSLSLTKKRRLCSRSHALGGNKSKNKLKTHSKAA